jgi:Flp pilus assembly protein protease CpaA
MEISKLQYLLKILIVINLALISIWDIKYLKIPDKMLGTLSIVLISSTILKKAMFSNIHSFFLVSILMIIYSLVTRIGGGDVKLISILSIYFKFKDIIIIFAVSTILAALVSIILIGLDRANLKTKIPLAPFIVAISLILVIMR